MKKFLVLAALALVAVGFAATQAEAQRLAVKQINWMQSDATVPGGKVFTQKASIAVGATDTTAHFSLLGCALPQAAFSDSVVIAWIVIGIDSSAAYSPAATSFTINLDVGGPGANELNLGTTGAVTFTDPTTTDRMVKIPIYNNFALARGIAGTVGNWGPTMRMRIVAIGGVWSAATVHLVYWDNGGN
jgi:hypothetical protein